MKTETYEELRNMLRELCRKREKLQEQIEVNYQDILETQCFAKKILDKQDEDFRVFSPRKIEDLYKEELEQFSARIDTLEKQNERLTVEQSKLDSMIRILKNVEEESRDTSEEDLSVIRIQEEDRQRIARDLHDSALQDLTHLIHKIELSSRFVDQDPVRAKMELVTISGNLREVINEIRSTIYDLRPMSFDDLGLKEAFEKMISDFKEKHCYEMDIRLENVSCENSLILITIYRIVRECFHNIEKHANAQKIFFHCIQEDNRCIIQIEDDGKGFSQEQEASGEGKHFGLLLIRERVALLGGQLEIDSEINRGTRIKIEIPLIHCRRAVFPAASEEWR